MSSAREDAIVIYVYFIRMAELVFLHWNRESILWLECIALYLINFQQENKSVYLRIVLTN